MRIGDLENMLLELIPASAAEPWDRTGMLVGDPDAPVTHVAVALDPSVAAIDFAKGNGANVLVTHHPLFLDPPCEAKPAGTGKDAVGARVWHAIASDVSIMSFHTALDANPRAASALARPLGLEVGDGLLEATPNMPGFGYGRICRAPANPLSRYTRACEDAFGRANRTWGDPDRLVETICLWTGAAGDAPALCADRAIDLLICGEVKYHAALDACERGLAIIELGHDVSEQPLCGVLVESIAKCGVPGESVFPMALPGNWR